MMTRLSRATLDKAPGHLRPPARQDVSTGIVHFGPGAFHRAHQASYIDTLLDNDRRWGIAAVSIRSRATIEALAEQDGLYTIAVRDRVPHFRIIDVHRAFFGPRNAAATHAFLAAPTVRLVTSTITEKGYCLDGDGALDLAHPDITADLADWTSPRSFVGWAVAGLAARRAAGVPPFVVMPCDNLATNGRKLHAALAAFARVHDPDLANWITDEVLVPCTMVDSITPASDDTLYADVADALGLEDRAAVQRESFLQWVIEDLGQDGPDLAAAGATLTSDVAAWERAKLRILNGSHSAIAYLGLLRGHATVADAMGDGWLAEFVERMIALDIKPSLPQAAGLDLDAYALDVLARFRNPAIAHRLEQIAQDGTLKLPYRLGDTFAANRSGGRMPERTIAALGCWVAFVIDRTRAGIEIVDPAGATLAQLAADRDPEAVVHRLARHRIGLPAGLSGDNGALASLVRATEAAVARDWTRLLPG